MNSGKKPFRDYADFLAEHFACKMQKLSVDAGMSCPNRDGTIGRGGCTYCRVDSFSPDYCRAEPSVSGQIEQGKRFFARKYPHMRYLAYFQSYTTTHLSDLGRQMALYEEALAVECVDGLVIGTRPDCMPDELLYRLSGLGKFVMVEYGAESSHDATLRAVNRCHTWGCVVDAVERTASAGLPVGLHLINGLPGERRDEVLATVDAVNMLPVDVVKFHQLQVVKGTALARQAAAGQVDIWNPTVEEYIELCCDIIQRLRPDIAIDRFLSAAPPDMVICPRWGLKNYQFVDKLLVALGNRANRLE